MRSLRIKSSEKLVRRRMAAAWVPDRSAEYWTRPYGEPKWVIIPASEFWMGSEGWQLVNQGVSTRRHLSR